MLSALPIAFIYRVVPGRCIFRARIGESEAASIREVAQVYHCAQSIPNTVWLGLPPAHDPLQPDYRSAPRL